MESEQLIIRKSENPLRQKSYSFALDVVKICLELQEKKEYILSKQLLRSATSVGAMVEEANQAESKADFIHKFKIAAKEVEEIKIKFNNKIATSAKRIMEKEPAAKTEYCLISFSFFIYNHMFSFRV